MRPLLTLEAAKTVLAVYIVESRLDYCHSHGT